MKIALLPCLLCALVHLAGAAEPFLQEPGPAKVAILEQSWVDAARKREVPVRIYYPEGATTPRPVVIFSHGLGGSREGYSLLGGSWASHELISVHLQHLGSDDSLWKGAPKSERLGRMRAGASPINSYLRVGDMTFALDRLEVLNTADGPLKGRLDLGKIGVAGHSFGALTVELVTGAKSVLGRNTADPRIKAVIAMSSPVPPGVAGYGQIKIPTFHMTGTEDSSPGTSPADRLIPFQQATFTPTYLVNFTGGTHMIFGGRPVAGGSELATYHEHILRLTNAFWAAHLNGNTSAATWLKDGSAAADTKPIGTFERK